jgi:hypothetical protein
MLVPAGLLVNGMSIRPEVVAEVTYHHVELPQHDVLLAEGAACESYLDVGNRGISTRWRGRFWLGRRRRMKSGGRGLARRSAGRGDGWRRCGGGWRFGRWGSGRTLGREAVRGQAC